MPGLRDAMAQRLWVFVPTQQPSRTATVPEELCSETQILVWRCVTLGKPLTSLDLGNPTVERILAILMSHGLAYLAKLQELPVVVDKGQNLLKVKVLLLALHPQVVEGQVNHIDPGQGCKEAGPE